MYYILSMVKSKVLNITTSKQNLKQTNEGPTYPRSISKTMEAVSKMRKWKSGCGGVKHKIFKRKNNGFQQN